MGHTDAKAERLSIGTCTFDAGRMELHGPDGRLIHLRPQALRVLEHLAERAGTVATRADLSAAVWPNVVVTDDSLVQCIGDIRRALGDSQRLLRTVPKVGYILDLDAGPSSAPVPASAPGVAAATDPARPSDGGDESRAAARRWWVGAALLVAAVAVGSVSANWWRRATGVAGSAGLAVRFRIEPSPATAADPALATGMSAEVVGQLARSTKLALAIVPTDAAADPAAVAARRLGASLMLDVRVKLEPASLTLTPELLDTVSGRSLWSHTHSGRSWAIERRALVAKVAALSGSGPASVDASAGPPHAARDLTSELRLARALGLVEQLVPKAFDEARSELGTVVESDPEYAPGWSRLAYLETLRALLHLGTHGAEDGAARRRQVLQRALALDAAGAEALLARAIDAQVDGRWADAVTAAERLQALLPQDATAAIVAANAWVAVGRGEEALRATDAASQRMRPAPALFDFVHAKALWATGQHAGAIEAASACLRKAPMLAVCRAVRAVAGDAMERLETAREDLRLYRQAVPGAPVHELGPGSYGVPRLKNEWLGDVRREIGLPP